MDATSSDGDPLEARVPVTERPDELTARVEPRPHVGGVRSLKRALAPSLATFIGYGSWALYVNWDHGWQRAVHAGVAQGTMSFTATLALTLIAEWLFHLAETRALGAVLAITGTPVVVIGPMVVLHWIAGTPHVARTVAPSAIVGSAYVVAYTVKLVRDRH